MSVALVRAGDINLPCCSQLNLAAARLSDAPNNHDDSDHRCEPAPVVQGRGKFERHIGPLFGAKAVRRAYVRIGSKAAARPIMSVLGGERTLLAIGIAVVRICAMTARKSGGQVARSD